MITSWISKTAISSGLLWVLNILTWSNPDFALSSINILPSGRCAKVRLILYLFRGSKKDSFCWLLAKKCQRVKSKQQYCTFVAFHSVCRLYRQKQCGPNHRTKHIMKYLCFSILLLYVWSTTTIIDYLYIYIYVCVEYNWLSLYQSNTYKLYICNKLNTAKHTVSHWLYIVHPHLTPALPPTMLIFFTSNSTGVW